MDVCHNNGGNNALIWPLVRLAIWHQERAPDHRLFVIAGRQTFSKHSRRGKSACGLGQRALRRATAIDIQAVCNETQDRLVLDTVPGEAEHPFVVHGIEEALDIRIQHPVHPFPIESGMEGV